MNVLVTRPDERGTMLVNMLAEQHIFALHQPFFHIEAGRELPQLPSALSRLKSGDYVFPVSKNAVDFANNTLKQVGHRWRADLNYIAVGQGTAHYFCSLCEQAVIYPLKSENSEGLLELPQLAELTGKTILILRAETGREYFPEQARLRGAEIQTLECYQRVAINGALNEQISLAKRAGIDTIVLTSGEMLNALVQHTDEQDHDWLFKCRLVVVGQRLARLAVLLGWQQQDIWISEKADNHSLFELLLEKRGK